MLALMRLRSDIGIFCLTEQANDHLMWVHYAKNHTGFVLGFNAHHSFFSEDNRQLGKVRYMGRPSVVREADITACLRKSVVWRHEKEWRCIRNFAREESRMVSFPWETVTEIVFGAKIEDWQVARIVYHANSYAQAYEIDPPLYSKSTPRNTSWSFENVQKNWSFARSAAAPAIVDGMSRRVIGDSLI